MMIDNIILSHCFYTIFILVTVLPERKIGGSNLACKVTTQFVYLCDGWCLAMCSLYYVVFHMLCVSKHLATISFPLCGTLWALALGSRQPRVILPACGRDKRAV